MDYEYDYLNEDKCALREYSPAPHFGLRTGLYSHIIKEPFYEYLPVKKTTSRYTPGDDRAIRKIPEWFEYEGDGYLSRHSTLESNGDSLVDSYARIYELSGSRMQVLPARHSLSIVGSDKNLLIKQDTVSYIACQSPVISGRWYVPATVTSHDGGDGYRALKKFSYVMTTAIR